MTTTTAVPARATTPRKKTTRAAAPDDHQAGGRHQEAAQHAVEANTTQLHLPLGGGSELHLTLPPLDKMAFYAGLAGAAAFGVIEWPIALLAGVGHLLSDDRRNRTLRALGEALDAA